MDRFILKHAICHQSPESIGRLEKWVSFKSSSFVVLFCVVFFRQEPDKDGGGGGEEDAWLCLHTESQRE